MTQRQRAYRGVHLIERTVDVDVCTKTSRDGYDRYPFTSGESVSKQYNINTIQYSTGARQQSAVERRTCAQRC